MPENIEKCIGVKLTSLEDLARFASSMATMGHGTYIVHFVENGAHVYGVFAIFRDYYKLYGLPLFYHIVLEKPLEGNYLVLDSDEAGERVNVSSGARPGRVSIPIINLEKKPEIVEV